jgi:hypothetical protein
VNRGILQSIRRRLGAWLALRTGLLLVGAVAALALAAALLDAAVDLPEFARFATPWLLAAAAALVIGVGVWRWRRFEDQRLARFFELAQPSLGSRLINAVQFSRQSGSGNIEEYLRLEAVALGRQAAAQVVIWPVVRRGVRMACATAGLALLSWVSLWLVGGGVLKAVVPRFVDPHGDHPPYSRVQIAVTPGKAEVLYGGQVEIRARVSAGSADKLWLTSKSGTNLTRTVMFLAPDTSFFQTLANLREPAEYSVTDGRARSHRFPIAIRYTPQITFVEVTMTFPEYTGKPGHTGKLGEEPQALPEDTRLEFRVASNRPLKSGLLSLTPVLGGKPAQVALSPESQNNKFVGGGFTLTQAVVFSISVRDVDGLESLDPRQGRFNILPDERPQLFVIEPGRDAAATPSIRVPVRVEATDDYGITRVAWLRGLNGSVERAWDMKLVPKAGPRSIEATGSFDFDRLGVHPGDVIEYYFEAADNYPKGPNVTLSRLYRIQIISQEEYEAILRQAAARKALFEPYFALDAWLRRLAERARDLDKRAQSGSEADQQAAAKDASELAKDLAKYETELGKLLQQAVLFDVEQAFRNTLGAQHTRVQQARKKLDAALAGNGHPDLNQIGEASRELSELAQIESEDVSQPAQQIAAVSHLLAKADTFVRLAQQQAALARMLRRFADRSGELSRLEQMEMQELAYQQRRVQEGLREMLNALPELLARVPDEPSYAQLRADVRDFIDAVAAAKIEEDLAQNALNLAALDGKTGYTLAQQAAEKMDRLISKCGGGMQDDAKTCLRFKPSVQKALGNTLEQILAAMGARGENGQGGQDGYALFNEDVALYGPNVELAGEQAGGRGEMGRAAPPRAERVGGAAPDPALPQTPVAARVRLQPDARFPLRYRELVGEYFRVIAESETEDGGKK